MVYWALPETKGVGPPARGGCACATVGSRVVYFGGADRATQAYNDLWVLETGNDAYEWTRITAEVEDGLTIYPRSGSTLTAIGEKLYLYGGQDIASGMCHASMLVLDTVTWRWSSVQVASKKQPATRHSHCAGKLAENSIVVFGGVGECGHLDDVWVFNTEQRAWTAPIIAAARPCAREMHSGTMLDATTMLIYGGRSSTGRVLDDAAILDMQTLTWRCVEPTPFSRCAHSAVVMRRGEVLGDASSNGRNSDLVVLIYGGFSGEDVQGDVFYIDPDACSEVEIVRRGPRPSDPPGARVPVPRFAHSVTTVPSRARDSSLEMVIFGGVTPAKDLADVAVLRCGDEEAAAMDTRPDDRGVVIEELDPDSNSREVASSSSLIQHQRGLVELKISEA